MDYLELISRYQDGVLNDAEFAALVEWIRLSPRNAAEFARASWDHSVLRELYSSEDVRDFVVVSGDDGLDGLVDTSRVSAEHIAAMLVEEHVAEQSSAPQNAPVVAPLDQLPTASNLPASVPRKKLSLEVRLTAAYAIAATLLLGVALYSRWFSPPPQVVDPPSDSLAAVVTAPEEVTKEPVARIVSTIDAVWANPDRATLSGTELFAGPMSLESGVVELEFARGATLIVQSPAEFNLLSIDRVELAFGKVVGKVPREAVGFTVKTQSAAVIDLGTEFCVQSYASGDCEVHVLDGIVEVVANGEEHQDRSRNTRLSAGTAVQVSEAGVVASIPAQSDRFHRKVPRVVSTTETVYASADLRLIDENGDELGDVASRITTESRSADTSTGKQEYVGVGERNSQREPDGNERRYAVAFDFPASAFGAGGRDLEGNQAARLSSFVDKAELRFTIKSKSHVRGYRLELVGIPLDNDSDFSAGSYHAVGSLLLTERFTARPANDRLCVADVTKYVKAGLEAGWERFAFRLQATGNPIPNNDNQANCILIYTTNDQNHKPELTVRGRKYDSSML